jgi:hypothetical protein
MPIPLRSDFDAARVRQAARVSQDGRQVRRLLALAAIYVRGRRAPARRRSPASHCKSSATGC